MWSPSRTGAQETTEAWETRSQAFPPPLTDYMTTQRCKTHSGQHPATDRSPTECGSKSARICLFLAHVLVQGTQGDANGRCFLLVERPGDEQQSNCRFSLRRCRAANDLRPQQLFDPFEDQFNLPACAVHLEDVLGRPPWVEGHHQHDHAQIE